MISAAPNIICPPLQMSQCVSVIRSVTDEVPSQHQPDPYPPDHSPPRPADVDLELRSGRIFNTEDDVFNFVKSYSSNVRAAFSCTSNNKKQVRKYYFSKPNYQYKDHILKCFT